MKEITLLPADIYTVVNKSVLTNVDRDNLIALYGPVLGSLPLNLYFSLWKDLKSLELISTDYTHHHLMSLLKSNLESIKLARVSLEAFGLIKTYVKEGNLNHYVYELYSPLSAYEFFSHPVFNVILYNNIGKEEYDNLKKTYESINYPIKDFKDITVSFNEIYKSVSTNESEIVNNNVINRTTLPVSAVDVIDFDFIVSSLPKGLLNEKTFNKKIRELINNLAFLYNLDSLKMSELIRIVINENGYIDKDELRKNTRKYYQYNNNGSLPTLIYRTQPEYLKNPDGDSSKRGKILYVFENTSPYDFLRSKYKGGNPTARDVKLLESLIVDQELKPAVVNVLIDYVLKINNNKLNQAYVETIAGQWKRSGVETAKDAMSLAEKEHKKKHKKVSVKEEKIPVWFNENIEKEEVSEEERIELETLLKDFR